MADQRRHNLCQTLIIASSDSVAALVSTSTATPIPGGSNDKRLTYVA